MACGLVYDAQMHTSRCCICFPIMQNGKVVDSQGYAFDPEDE
jgi:hypothetical protein